MDVRRRKLQMVRRLLSGRSIETLLLSRKGGGSEKWPQDTGRYMEEIALYYVDGWQTSRHNI